MNAPLITIFVRHSADCKYAGDEFCKRCNCRKHLRWTQDGTQYRRKAGTRSWHHAEEEKRRLEDQLAGSTPRLESTTGKHISEAITVFIQSKKNKNITKKVLDKYTRELARLRTFCESEGVLAVQALTGELLTEYCGTWPELYPSTTTRAKVRERCRSFIRYCYQVRWLDRGASAG
jgi:integrase/recombinase XerD